MKRCTKCARELPPDGFAKGRATCRECRAAYDAAYRAANRERIAVRNAARYATNRVRILAQQTAYHAANPHMKWVNSYRERARRYGLPIIEEPFTRDDVVERYGDACAHCGGPFEQLDHHPVPVAEGGPHILDNVRPSCEPCNKAGAKAAANARAAQRRASAQADGPR